MVLLPFPMFMPRQPERHDRTMVLSIPKLYANLASKIHLQPMPDIPNPQMFVPGLIQILRRIKL